MLSCMMIPCIMGEPPAQLVKPNKPLPKPVDIIQSKTHFTLPADFQLPESPPAPKAIGERALHYFFTDDFEGPFPGKYWSVYAIPSPQPDIPSVNAYWGKTNYAYYTPYNSVWCAASGPNGVNPAASNYPNNMNAWMVAGPFDFTNVTAAYLTFNAWFDCEKSNSETGEGDVFAFGYSVDGYSYYGYLISGKSVKWIDDFQIDFSESYGGPIGLGQRNVYIAFVFYSDNTINSKGAYVDDVKVFGYLQGPPPTPSPTPQPTKTHTPTPTPTPPPVGYHTTFQIQNTGTAALRVTNITKEKNSSWLSFLTHSAYPIRIAPNASATVDVYASAAGLAKGVYNDRLVIYSDVAGKNPYPDGYHVTLNVAPATPTPTPAPVLPSVVIGTIADIQTRKPVNGATVQIDGGALKAFSNAQGKFYIHGVSPGAHTLQVWGFAYEYKEKNINVSSNSIYDAGSFNLLKVAGTVVGRLTDSTTDEPLAAATVQLDGGDQWRTLTDEQGNFMLIFVAPGAHKLQAWGYAYTFQEHNIVVNSSGPTDVGNKSFMIIPDTVRGQIVDKGTGRPILGAHVQYDGGGEGKQVATNITGRYILVSVPAGNHELQSWGWAYGFNQKKITHSAGTATDAGQLALAPVGGTVNGRLLDAVNGLPVYNATIQLDGGNYAPWKTTSQLNGDFIVYDVTGGTHQFQTWGYAYRFLQQAIECVTGQNKSMGDIQLTPDPNTFNGRVLDAQTRLPISGAEVVCTGAGKTITTKSFPDGRFVLLNVPKGVFDITVDATGKTLVYFKSAHPGENLNVELGDVLIP